MSSTASWFCPPFLMRMTGAVPWQVDGTHPLESKIYSLHCFIGEKKKIKRSKPGLIYILL